MGLVGEYWAEGWRPQRFGQGVGGGDLGRQEGLWGWGDEDEGFGYSRGYAVFEGYGGVEEEGCGEGGGRGGFGVKGWGEDAVMLAGYGG